MVVKTEYRVISESDGWVTEYDTEDKAEQRARELDNKGDLPSDHYVEEHKEVW
jgi:hypothetical protein